MKGKGLLIIGAIVLILLIGGCNSYRRIVTLDETAKGQWGNVENQLQRRYDLIPSLIETVKGYAAHESQIFTDIANARQAYFSAPTAEAKAQATGAVEGALSRLLMLQENYPQLRANESFLKFQDQLEGTENRLAVERGRYNDTVKELNAYLRSPMGLVGNFMAQVKPREYVAAPEGARTAPKVDFSRPAATTPPGPSGP
ncbi:MAG: LemA family protein [Planctomycetes bacterium]|nr:LemA family protein [Planctomycetota bacterium]